MIILKSIIDALLFMLGALFGTVVFCALAVAIAFAICCTYICIKGFIEACHESKKDK